MITLCCNSHCPVLGTSSLEPPALLRMHLATVNGSHVIPERRFPAQQAISRQLHALLRQAANQGEVQALPSAFPVLAEAGGQLGAEAVQFWAPAPLLQVRAYLNDTACRPAAQCRCRRCSSEQRVVIVGPALCDRQETAESA